MTTGSILLGVAILLLVVLFVARPLIQRAPVTPLPRTSRQRLLAQKEALLTEISSLDFDYETGKLPPELYQHQRAVMVAEAAAILEQLDSLPQVVIADAEIEAAITQLRGQAPAAPVVAPPVAVAVSGTGNGHGRFCTQCGSTIDPNDKFCAHCGSKITSAAVTPV